MFQQLGAELSRVTVPCLEHRECAKGCAGERDCQKRVLELETTLVSQLPSWVIQPAIVFLSACGSGSVPEAVRGPKRSLCSL